MRFLHGKVRARKGQTIRVHFSEPTRILVMTQKNFEKYKNNLTFTYYGGRKEESPYDFAAPMYADWYVVVEKGPYYEPIELTASIELVAEEPKSEVVNDELSPEDALDETSAYSEEEDTENVADD